MKLEITDYETTVIKGIHTDIFFGTCEGIDFIAEHGSSEYCGAEWRNGAIKGKGFDTLFENNCSILKSWNFTELQPISAAVSTNFKHLSRLWLWLLDTSAIKLINF